MEEAEETKEKEGTQEDKTAMMYKAETASIAASKD